MDRIDVLIIIFALMAISIVIIQFAHADSNVNISNAGIGGDLTIMVHAYNVTHHNYQNISEKVYVEISKNDYMIDSGSCTTFKRNGDCSISIKLIDNRYINGQYDVMVKIGHEIKRFNVYIWETGY